MGAKPLSAVSSAARAAAGSSVSAHPSHDRHILTERIHIAVQDLIPENQVTLLGLGLRFDMLDQLMIEIRLQVTPFLRTDLFEQTLAIRVAFPFLCGAFVATQVQIAEGEHLRQFVNHVACKLDRLRIGHVDDVRRHTLSDPNLMLLVGVARKEFRISSDSSL